MIQSGSDFTRDTRLDYDLVVVGTGAGGGMLLHDAALAGLRVIAIEEGEYRTSQDFDGQERHMLPLLYQDAAGRTTTDGAIAILQGRGVGGSTVHNTNLCKRAPDAILDDWAARFGLDGWRAASMAEDYAAVEKLLSVSPIEPERVNANNDVLLRGMRRLGWRGGLLSHNRKGCAGSGQCELGCPFDAKENVLKALLPGALAQGARVIAELRAERILLDNGRAVGIRAACTGARRGGGKGPVIEIRARAVALSGSAIGSAALALASGLGDRNGLVGRNLHIHPGIGVAGLFDERIEGWSGIPQSVECTEHIDFVLGSERRVWIVPAFAHPVGFAASLPGFGATHMKAMRGYANAAILVAMLHDESSGRVEARRDGSPVIRYALNDGDARALGRGVRACVALLRAAGAREVVVPCARPNAIGRDDSDATVEKKLAGFVYRPLDPPLTAVHPMGTLPMAADPKRGITDGAGRWHGVAGLYVSDGSLFPTSIGGPPQITIYTAGRKVARAVVADLARG